MNSKKFSDAMCEIDDKYVDEAIHYKRKSKKTSWVKWGAMAACVCIIAVAVLVIPDLGDDDMAKIYTLSQAEYMDVELVEWQDEGFKAVVTDTGNNSLFPVGAELTIHFEEETEIVLSDGTFFDYNSEEPKAGAVGWVIGSVIRVEYLNYEQYLEEKEFSNRVYVSFVEERTSAVTD